jgi:hypothetical protein
MSKNNTLTAAGGSLYVDSNSKQAVKFDSNGNAITSPAGIFIVGDYQLSAQNSISPTPTTGVPAIDDPLALAPIPVVAGPVKNYVAKTSVTLNPGIYKGFDIPAGDTVTMNPGTYVIIPDTSHNGVLGLVVHGTLVADGVTLYLACANYPTACSSGEIGAILDDEGGSLRISPPAGGTYWGMSVMADRANAGSNILDQGIFESVTGTWYTLRMAFTAIHFNVTINAGAIIVDSFQLVQGTTLNLTYVPGSSYFPPGGFVPLTRLVLSQ